MCGSGSDSGACSSVDRRFPHFDPLTTNILHSTSLGLNCTFALRTQHLPRHLAISLVKEDFHANQRIILTCWRNQRERQVAELAREYRDSRDSPDSRGARPVALAACCVERYHHMHDLSTPGTVCPGTYSRSFRFSSINTEQHLVASGRPAIGCAYTVHSRNGPRKTTAPAAPAAVLHISLHGIAIDTVHRLLSSVNTDRQQCFGLVVLHSTAHLYPGVLRTVGNILDPLSEPDLSLFDTSLRGRSSHLGPHHSDGLRRLGIAD